MNNAYDHKKAIINHVKKHIFLGIALGLTLLSLLFMFLPYVSMSLDEAIVGGNHTVIQATFNGFQLAFGGNYMVYKTIDGVAAENPVYMLSASFGLIIALVFLLFAIGLVTYVYLEEKYYPLAFLGAFFLTIAAICFFCVLPVCGFETKITNGTTDVVNDYYNIQIGAILSGGLLVVSVALIIIDYFIVYVPSLDTLEYVKYKQDLVDKNILVSVRHLKVFFPMGGHKRLKAVHDVSFDIKKGECFGLVGESGCGKTTTGRSIIRLHHITSGSIYFKGYRIAAGSRWNEKEIKWSTIRAKNAIKELQEREAAELENVDNVTDEGKRQTAEIHAKYLAKQIEIQTNLNQLVAKQKAKIRQIQYDDVHNNRKLLSKMQMIFQDPIDSLDPRMTVEDIIQEGLKIQGYHNRVENHKKACKVLEEVGLIADYCSRYPNEFSGGQRQRIGIARAIVMNPEFMICDEPISALDVSIRAQIINLLNDLKENHGLTLMFIAHDLSVVKYFCDRIAVMYFGEMVEMAPSDELFAHPLHPYTRALLSAIPKPDPYSEKKRVRIIYNPKTEHDYSVEKPTFQEILPGHWVLANTPEMAKYHEMIKEADIKNAEEEKKRKEAGLEY